MITTIRTAFLIFQILRELYAVVKAARSAGVDPAPLVKTRLQAAHYSLTRPGSHPAE